MKRKTIPYILDIVPKDKPAVYMVFDGVNVGYCIYGIGLDYDGIRRFGYYRSSLGDKVLFKNRRAANAVLKRLLGC